MIVSYQLWVGHFVILSVDMTTTCLEVKKIRMEAEHPISIASRWMEFFNVSIRDLSYSWTRAQTRFNP
jgi:hypothetical protein